MHVCPKVFGVDAEGIFIRVDGFLVLSHHAVHVADVGPGLAVVRVFVDEVLEIVKGFLLAACAEVAAADFVVKGVDVFRERQGFVVELQGEVEFFQALVFVGDGVVKIKFFVLVEIGQGAEIVLQGFLRLAQDGKARTEGEEIVGVIVVVAFHVLHDVEGALGIVFQKILPCILDFQHIAFGMLGHCHLHGLSRAFQLVVLRVMVDDVFKFLTVEIDRIVRLQHGLILLDGRLPVLFFLEIILKIFVLKHVFPCLKFSAKIVKIETCRNFVSLWVKNNRKT